MSEITIRITSLVSIPIGKHCDIIGRNIPHIDNLEINGYKTPYFKLTHFRFCDLEYNDVQNYYPPIDSVADILKEIKTSNPDFNPKQIVTLVNYEIK